MVRWVRDAIVAWHEREVHVPRVELVARAMAAHLEPRESLLDVGCGTGEVALRVAGLVDAVEARGVDVRLRPRVVVPAEPYDGRTLPFDDGRFDVVLLADVLHHCDDPGPVLREALRVARRAVIVKDHLAFGPLSRLALLAMDHVGNAGPGVRVTGTYLDVAGWVALCASVDARIARLSWPVRTHRPPVSIVTSPDLQFVATIERAVPLAQRCSKT